MNYQKLDSSLAMALNNVQNPEEASLVVFIHTEKDLDSTASSFLENLGVSNTTSGTGVFTATLSPNAISQLSEQPWVKQIKSSQNMRLLPPKFGMGNMGA
jgi:hypothetical protein